jgi:predicted SprT family Zn-dependent metalloprotease
MKTTRLYGLAALVVFLLVLAAAHAQDDMEFIDPGVFGNPRRAPSVFVHDEHNETAQIEECNECHHVYEDGRRLEDESSEDMRCADCHELKGGDNLPLMKAFHMNCKGCHIEQKKGPVMCGDCHRK